MKMIKSFHPETLAALAKAPPEELRLEDVRSLAKRIEGLAAPFIGLNERTGTLHVQMFFCDQFAPLHHASPFEWGGDGALEVQFKTYPGATVRCKLTPGSLLIHDGEAQVWFRVEFEDDGDDAHANVLADAVDATFGYVSRVQGQNDEDFWHLERERRVLIWRRPSARCELLQLLDRCFDRPFTGEFDLGFKNGALTIRGSMPDDFDPWPALKYLLLRRRDLEPRPILHISVIDPHVRKGRGTSKRKRTHTRQPKRKL